MTVPSELRRESFLECIHCGLCLEACPTYRETFDEGLSPRGRVALLKALATGALTPDAEAAHALSHCLLCCSCQAACPSGVQYEWLMSRAREQLAGARAAGRERFWLRRIRGLFHQRWRLSLTLRLIRTAVRTGLAGLGVRVLFPRQHHVHYVQLVSSLRSSAGAARSVRKRRRGLVVPVDALIFRGCVTPVFFPQVLAALESVLRKAGVSCATPRKQVCCGALHLHTGDLAGARRLARRNVAAFEAAGAGIVLVEASGCAAALKEYGTLLADDPEFAGRARAFAARGRDATEYLWEVRERALPGSDVTDEERGHSVGTAPRHVVYQDACHLRHLQGIARQPRHLLDSFPQLTRAAAVEEDLCCGSAGIYNLLRPSMAASLGERKADALAASGAEVVVTANPGCRVQLEGRLRRRGMTMRHIVEVCDAYWPEADPARDGLRRGRSGRPESQIESVDK